MFIFENKAYAPLELLSFLENAESLSDWQVEIRVFLKNWFDKNDFVFVQTSGSTGPAKRMVVKKVSMQHSAQSTNRFFKLDASKILLAALPVKYIAGKMMLIRAMEAGSTLILTEPKSNPLEHLDSHIDFVALTPYQLLQSIKAESRIDFCQTILLGGEKVSSSLLNWIEGQPTSFYSSYGMTETITHVALQSLNHPKEDCYTLLPGIVAKPNDSSCIGLSGGWIEGFVQTNDRVEFLNKRQFVFLGRADFVINSGGIKIDPEYWEQQVSEVFPFRWIISSRPHQASGEHLVVVAEESAGQLFSVDEILEKINSIKYAELKVKELVFMKLLPNTPSGKINRYAVKKWLANNNFSS